MTQLRALVLTPDGEIEEKWFPATGNDFLNALYAAINCNNVEAVHLGYSGHHATMYVDMEGTHVQFPMPNEYATVLVGGFNHAVHQVYFGTAVFLGAPDDAGDDTSLSELANRYIRSLVGELKRAGLTPRDIRERRF